MSAQSISSSKNSNIDLPYSLKEDHIKFVFYNFQSELYFYSYKLCHFYHLHNFSNDQDLSPANFSTTIQNLGVEFVKVKRIYKDLTVGSNAYSERGSDSKYNFFREKFIEIKRAWQEVLFSSKLKDYYEDSNYIDSIDSDLRGFYKTVESNLKSLFKVENLDFIWIVRAYRILRCHNKYSAFIGSYLLDAHVIEQNALDLLSEFVLSEKDVGFVNRITPTYLDSLSSAQLILEKSGYEIPKELRLPYNPKEFEISNSDARDLQCAEIRASRTPPLVVFLTKDD